MISIKNLLFFFLLCLASSFQAQINLDSLNRILPTSKGTDKIDLLNIISWELKFSDPDRALELCDESIDLSRTMGYVKGEAIAHYQLAAFHYLKGEMSKSLEVSKKSIALYESIDNSKGMANNWNLSGMNLQRLNKHDEAMESFEKAVSTCELFGYENILRDVRANMANLSYSTGDYKKAIEKYSLIAATYLEKGDTSKYFTTLQNIAKTQEKLGKYSEALSNYFKIEIFEKSKNRKLPLANTYNDMGLLYLKLGLKEQPIEVFEKAIKLYRELGNHRKEAMVDVNLGVYFSDNENFEQAEFFYKKALHTYDSLGLNNTGRIYNNLASLKNKTNQFEEALTLLEKSLNINLEIENKHDIASNYANMGAAYFGLDQLSKAEQFYLKAINLNRENDEYFEIKKNSEFLSEIYKLTNNKDAFEVYSSLAQAASDSLFANEKLIEVNRLLVTNLYQEHQNKTNELLKELSLTKDQLALLEKKNSSFFSQYKVSLIGFFALVAIGISWLFFKQKRNSQKNKTLENNATETIEKLETSLESKNKELTLLSLEAAQQTDLFKKIHHSLQQITSKDPENLEIKKLEKMLLAHSLDQHNWENFNAYFNEVYPGFFDNLSQSFPSITNKELRLCALIRLRIPSFEASVILGISPRSVHKSRYRIRKKMELTSEANIDKFICSI